MSWRESHAITALKAEVNTAHPGRSTASDGTKGDDAHAHRVSDHNPDAAGIVHAWDCTVWDDTDVDFDDDVARPLAEFLRAKRDPRTKYVIHRGQMFSSYDSYKAGKLWRKAWTWGIYTGPNGHFHHVHVSVYGDDGAPWGYPFPTLNPQPPEFTVNAADEAKIREIVAAQVAPLTADVAEIKRQVTQSQDANAPKGRTLRHIASSLLKKP